MSEYLVLAVYNKKEACIYHACRYGREGRVAESKSEKVIFGSKTREEIVEELALAHMKMFYPHDFIDHSQRMRKWKENRDLIERFEGNLEKYERYYPKPELKIREDSRKWVDEHLEFEVEVYGERVR